ncbi:carboxypeptidase-like regulatory domain-containing protein [Dysgonomonas sp. GY617]|uniref:carboxypeptidase-like regulatory domain-containing protein n=1 Tax=Dysgonomonas sp. GY617 TaxID=2780420 RepID=UPI001883671E|nr:carboxypeptidase-like regulatory domain-containing protein [Dysgonomonas sp. GY617]MBF0577481.1 carboxypeptidase-like regulatory domain-containing protein [Dysgonomonas sp. GY617]
MKRTTQYLFHYVIPLLLLFSIAATAFGNDGDILSRKIELSKNKGTVYQLLKEVSDKSGYLFIYDSQIVNNDKAVKVPKKEYTLREAIYAITGNKSLNIRIVGNHILLNLQPVEDVVIEPVVKLQAEKKDSIIQYITLGGTLVDGISGDPIPYAAVGILTSTIGTITNQNGDFRLILPDSLRHSKIKLSHVGYQSQEVELSFLADQHIIFTLDPKVIPLQEVVIRIVNPADVLRNMWLKRSENYSSSPVHITAFYREGIEHKNTNVSLTEAVLDIYKIGFQSGEKGDQVKLLKMRRIIDRQSPDTLITKMKSGINSSLLLDLIKSDTPGFLNPINNGHYIYRHTDITVLDGRRVNVIFFEPTSGAEPLYKGELYIDAESYALVQANFEILPDYVKKATDMFIVRKSRDINITPQHITYVVSYKSLDGIYYLSHVRGDLYFRVRKKKRIFSTPLHMWFELVNCETDTSDNSRFARNERLSTQNIFSDTSFEYDPNFWGHFNVIMQEDKLKESVLQILKKNK